MTDAPPSRDDAPPPREDEGPPARDDAPPPREDEGPPARDDAPPPREDEGPPARDDAPPPREDEVPPARDDAPPPREDEGPPARDDAPPPREDEGPPARDDVPPPREDEGPPPREDEAPPAREDAPPPRLEEPALSAEDKAAIAAKEAEAKAKAEEAARLEAKATAEAEEAARLQAIKDATPKEISKRAKRDSDRQKRYNDLLAQEAAAETTKREKKVKSSTADDYSEVKEVEKEERPQSQLKMLERLKFSKEFWKKERIRHEGEEKEESKQSKDSKRNTRSAKSERATAEKNDKRTIYEAAAEGDVRFVKQYVQHRKWDVRRHHDRGGTGSTVLHMACWRSHVELVKWLTEHVRRAYGYEAMETYVNCRDTIMNGVTPLMEAARTHIGNLKDRINVLKCLIDAGAKTHYKDAHGDTCLHWAARNGSMPVIKFLLHNTEGAVFTAMEDNYVHKRPIDVAFATMEKRQDSSSKEAYNQLMNMMKGSNVRMKIQRLKMRAEREQKDKKAQVTEDIARIMEEARISHDAAELEWLRQRSAAEQVRSKEEDEYVNTAGEKGEEAAIKYMDSREGKAEVKIKSRDIERKMRDEIKERGEKVKGAKVAKTALNKAKAAFVREKVIGEKKQAQRDFRRKNPADFDKREFEAMEKARDIAEKRYAKLLVDRDKQLRDDIDESSGMCSEPELNLNPYCKMYTGW